MTIDGINKKRWSSSSLAIRCTFNESTVYVTSLIKGQGYIGKFTQQFIKWET